MSKLLPLVLVLTLGCSGGEPTDVTEERPSEATEPGGETSSSYLIRKGGGLVVEVLEEGSGRPVKAGDWITVHYRGTIVESGRVFGDTFKKGVPFGAYLRRGKIIAGWERGLVGLRVGTRAKLEIPADLAYGEMGMPGSGIPPGADLSYEIEVLDTAARPKRN